MLPEWRSPPVALGALGVCSVASSYAIGGTVTYGFGFSGYAYLFHGSLFVLLLAVTSAIVARTSLDADRGSVVSAVVASVELYLVAVGLLWYEVAGPSWTELSPALLDLAVERLEFVLPMTPLAAGYMLGISPGSSSSRGATAVGAVGLLYAIGGPIMGFALVANRGYPPLFTAGFYPMVVFGGLVAAVPVYLLVRATTGGSRKATGPAE